MKHTNTVLALILILAASTLPGRLSAQIKNGGFETCDASGWTLLSGLPGTAGAAGGTWALIQDGDTITVSTPLFDSADCIFVTQASSGLPITVSVPDGRFALLQINRFAQTHRIYQTVALPDVPSLTLHWAMWYRNLFGSFVQDEQDIVVTIRDPDSDAVLAGGELFRLVGGDPLELAAAEGFSRDLSAFRGETVRVSFEINARADAVDSNRDFDGIHAIFDEIRIEQGAGVFNDDSDADGVLDADDNCVDTANPEQLDFDEDGVGDLCDNCPSTANADQADGDVNGFGDACETGGFTDGDIFVFMSGYRSPCPRQDESLGAIVRVEPYTGAHTALTTFDGFFTNDAMTHDPHRDLILVKRGNSSADFLTVDGAGNQGSIPIAWSHRAVAWAPAGDGRIYMIGGPSGGLRPIGRMDENDIVTTVLDLDGSLLNLETLGAVPQNLIYDLGTNSLFLAERGASTTMWQVPLTPDGSALRAPVRAFAYDAYPGQFEEPEGVSAGPNGKIFVKLDVNTSLDGVLMFKFDPVTHDFEPFTLQQGGIGASTIGTYSSLLGRGLGWGTVPGHTSKISAVGPIAFEFAPGPQPGEPLAAFRSSASGVGEKRMISIGDTINRSYRMTVELDKLRDGGVIYGLAGETVRLHGTAFLQASRPGVDEWTVSLRAIGTGAAMGAEPCDTACASRLVFINGVDEVASNAPGAVDPDAVPDSGPLAGIAQGPGVVDHVTLDDGVTLGTQRIKILRFFVDVVVPDGDEELVELTLGDGLQGAGGVPLANTVAFDGDTFDSLKGLFLGSMSFRVRAAELISENSLRAFTLTAADPIKVFALPPSESAALLLDLTDPEPDDANALYFSQGRTLIPGRFELAADRRFQPDQRLAVYALREEPSFIECRATILSGGSNDVTLSVEGKQLALASFSAPHAGNRPPGLVTAAIRGAGFSDDTTFRLRAQGAGDMVPTTGAPLVLSAGRAEASFDFSTAPLGVYNLLAEKAGGAIADQLEAAFELEPSSIGPLLEARVSGSKRFRYMRTSRITIHYSNVGDAEMPAPIFRITGPPGTEMRLAREDDFQLEELHAIGAHPDGVAGTLPPGGEGRIEVVFRLGQCPPCAPDDPGCPTSCADVFRIEALGPAARSAIVGWDALAPPGGMPEEVWERAWPELSRRLGGTWDDVRHGLSIRTTRLAHRGGNAASLTEVFRFAVREALGLPTAATIGRLTSNVTGSPLEGQTVLALEGENVASFALTDFAGDFAIDWLERNTAYTLAVVDGEIVPAASANITTPDAGGLRGDRFGIVIAADPQANELEASCANCETANLPTAPLAPPPELFELVAVLDFEIVNSFDPNDKNGPGGLGDPVPPEEELEYSVYFENEAGKATAPAQQVVVTDQLDPAVYDFGSFEVRDIRIGNLPYQFLPLGQTALDITSGYSSAPAHQRYTGLDSFTVTTPVAIDGETTIDVEHTIEVDWHFDTVTGLAQWILTSDSENADAGVLPVNDEMQSGEGHVSFVVRPLAGLAQGTGLENDADIDFDFNPTIVTPTWSNNIDLSLPPGEPELPRPPHDTGGVSPDVVLQWNATFAEAYEVFLWSDSEPKPTTPIEVTEKFFVPTAALGAGLHRWQVVAKNANGDTQGDTWSFTVSEAPACAGTPAVPSPADGAIDIAGEGLVLGWAPLGTALGYAVFVWPAVEPRPQAPLVAGIVSPQAPVTIPLDAATEYAWQVLAIHNGNCITSGDVWTLTTARAYLRGDSNGDGGFDISDPQHTLAWLFTSGPPPACVAAADANADGAIDVSDAIAALLALFVNGIELASPYPDCAAAPGGALGCEGASGCP